MTSRSLWLGTKSWIILFSLSVAVPAIVPFVASAQTENKTRLVFEIKNLSTITIPDNITIPRLDVLHDGKDNEQKNIEVAEEQKVDNKAQILQDYLAKRGSPLADYADHLLKQENWKLVIAISNGESGLCKHQLAYNCWGITRSRGLERYESFAEGITDANAVIDKYVSRGADTPEEMVRRYVAWNNRNWVRAVNQTLNQLEQLPLEN
jgi:hypothetical protein